MPWLRMWPHASVIGRNASLTWISCTLHRCGSSCTVSTTPPSKQPGGVPLYYVASCAHELVDHLAFEYPNAIGDSYGAALYVISYTGHAHIVRSLLQCEDVLGSDYVTPLQSASLKGHLDTVRCLPVLNVQPCRRCKSSGRLPHNPTTLCSTQWAPRRHSGT